MCTIGSNLLLFESQFQTLKKEGATCKYGTGTLGKACDIKLKVSDQDVLFRILLVFVGKIPVHKQFSNVAVLNISLHIVQLVNVSSTIPALCSASFADPLEASWLLCGLCPPPPDLTKYLNDMFYFEFHWFCWQNTSS